VWKRKQEEPKKEECGLAMYAQEKEANGTLIVDFQNT
jgi:hypothetical protein